MDKCSNYNFGKLNELTFKQLALSVINWLNDLFYYYSSLELFHDVFLRDTILSESGNSQFLLQDIGSFISVLIVFSKFVDVLNELGLLSEMSMVLVHSFSINISN